jgi:hypothetical protein
MSALLPDATMLRWWLWLAAGQWRAAPGRAATSVLAVAIGVALALAIHLVNASALEEFRQAIATVNGEAHAQIRARGESLDEATWARLADPPIEGLAAASPVIETEVAVAGVEPGTAVPATGTGSGSAARTGSGSAARSGSGSAARTGGASAAPAGGGSAVSDTAPPTRDGLPAARPDDPAVRRHEAGMQDRALQEAAGPQDPPGLPQRRRRAQLPRRRPRRRSSATAARAS